MVQPSCEQDAQSVLSGSHTNMHVPHSSQAQLSSAGNCFISNGLKEETQHYSHCEKKLEFNNITINIPYSPPEVPGSTARVHKYVQRPAIGTQSKLHEVSSIFQT